MKMNTHYSKSMGHSKSSPERGGHSITGLPQEARKILNKQSNPASKRTRALAGVAQWTECWPEN